MEREFEKKRTSIHAIAENILMHQCVHFLFMAQIDHLTFAPPSFDRLSPWNPLGRIFFSFHLPPLFFFFSSLGWNWKSSIETRIRRLFSSLSLLSPRLLLLLALLIFDWNQRSAQILGPLCSWELYDSSRFRPIFLPALD